mgnify:CR=1 FL=1
METHKEIIGSYKEYIIIERSDLHELKDKAAKLLSEADNDISNYHKGITIMEVVKFIKERNIYNREFKLKS